MATKKKSPGKAPKAPKAPKPERTIPKKPRKEKPKKATKAPKAPEAPKAKPLTAEQRAGLPPDLLAAADGGDQSAAERIAEIVSAQDAVLAAEANQKQVRQDCKTRTEQEKSTFEQSIEASYRSDAGPEVIKSKLEDIQSKYQDYKEALALNAEERKAATNELKDAKKRRDEAIEGAAQLNLPFGANTGKTVAVRANGDEVEVERGEVAIEGEEPTGPELEAGNKEEDEPDFGEDEDEIDLEDEDEDEDEIDLEDEDEDEIDDK